MAVSIVKVGDTYNSSIHEELLIDSASDLVNLPGIDKCAPGSIAELVGGGTYVLSPNGVWTLQSAASGSVTQTVISGDATLIYSGEITASYNSSNGDPILEPEYTQATGIPYSALYAVVEDKNGKRNGYFWQSETVMEISSDSTTTAARGVVTRMINTSGDVVTHSYGGGTTTYGIFISSFNQSGTLKVYARYDSGASGIINGTYTVRVYGIKDPGVV